MGIHGTCTSRQAGLLKVVHVFNDWTTLPKVQAQEGSPAVQVLAHPGQEEHQSDQRSRITAAWPRGCRWTCTLAARSPAYSRAATQKELQEQQRRCSTRFRSTSRQGRSPSLLSPLRDGSNVAEQVLPPRDLCKGACLWARQVWQRGGSGENVGIRRRSRSSLGGALCGASLR